jgi:hypothetical protein
MAKNRIKINYDIITGLHSPKITLTVSVNTIWYALYKHYPDEPEPIRLRQTHQDAKTPR